VNWPRNEGISFETIHTLHPVSFIELKISLSPPKISQLCHEGADDISLKSVPFLQSL
jgi:hypothetical protein